MSRPNYFRSDDVIYCENAAGHVFLTTFESPLPEGFIRSVAITAADKERVWAKISEQEKRHAEGLSKALYERRKEGIARSRSNLEQEKLRADCPQYVRDFIRAGLELLDRKEDALNKFSAYGVAAMQETEAPLPSSAVQKVIITDASSD